MFAFNNVFFYIFATYSENGCISIRKSEFYGQEKNFIHLERDISIRKGIRDIKHVQ